MKRFKKFRILATVALSLVIATSAGTIGQAKTSAIKPMLKVQSQATSTYTSGYSPAQIRTAYGIDALANEGEGSTIAIVDAYGDPNISNDLAEFDSQFTLPAPPSINVSYPQGKPSKDAGWALETALDVEWAHAIAPKAHILVVAAKSASTANLLGAVDFANRQSVNVVSMSWGGNEFSSENTYDSYFSHSGTAYLASAGDDGAAASWPASSAKVVAVGGTTLTMDSSNHRLSETAWSGSGGDNSKYVSEPAWQTKMNISSNGKRAIPDVSFDADPATGVAVYSSISYNGTKGWFRVGGTSLSAPAWAGLIALGDNYTGISNANELLYRLAGGTSYADPQVNFYDVVSGSNGNTAGSGYDLVTGLGSPVADKLIPKT